MMTQSSTRQLRSVVFTDIEGYSKLTQADEQLALTAVMRYQRTVTRLTRAYSGELVHFYGDGSLSIHDSAVEAVQCALAIQQALRSDPLIPVRIGIHLGEIVRKEDSIFGNTVNVASRLHNLGPGGSILVSETVATQLSSHPQVKVRFIGVETVKNITDPVRIFAIDHASLVVPTWNDLRKRNRTRRRSTLVLPLLFLLAIVAIGVYQAFIQPAQERVLFGEERVVVLPFKNNTGDSTLAFIGQIAGRHISRCLEESDDARIVSYDHLIQSDQLSQFRIFPLHANVQAVGARHFIEGSYLLLNDSTLQFESAMRDSRSLEYIQHFPIVTAHLSQVGDGIRSLGQRIAGYWMSKEETVLTIPLQDAYKAFMVALRHWHSDYDKAIAYLQRSIAIDSTFLDAYYFLFDAYANQWQYDEAAAVFDTIEQRFKLEELTERQLDYHRFYEAQVASDNEQAFKSLRRIYHRDPQELFVNTQMAVCAMHFVNEPELCLEVLEQIPFDSIDFEINAHARDRISLAIQACFASGRYERAAEYARYYPRDDQASRHYELHARALAGIRDTSGISTLLKRAAISGDTHALRVMLYGLSRDFRLLGEPELARFYTHQALEAYRTYPSAIYGHLLFDTGDIAAGIALFERLQVAYGDHAIVLFGLARGAALQGNRDQVDNLLKRLDSVKPERFDFGQTEYDQARIYAFLNAHDHALIKLEHAIDKGLFFSMRHMHNDPDLQPLFDDPRYTQLAHPLRS